MRPVGGTCVGSSSLGGAGWRLDPLDTSASSSPWAAPGRANTRRRTISVCEALEAMPPSMAAEHSTAPRSLSELPEARAGEACSPRCGARWCPVRCADGLHLSG